MLTVHKITLSAYDGKKAQTREKSRTEEKTTGFPETLRQVIERTKNEKLKQKAD